ncbi:hypothetical protein [Neptuniibacter sp.]|uniref:hypothetical protein n=1 Tax=Neptuniibacter sp. TaxID=1962643 RepID=UPI002624EB01|nr:hypothetical protein [Neptuniibacter sp.]MCP4596184.1 hypothetical protein [Neptuniibacter sp.]
MIIQMRSGASFSAGDSDMGYQIAFCWSEKSEAELIEMGFKKKEVYIKDAPSGMTKESNAKGDQEFFDMKNPPGQFKTTSWWAACPE